jgi:DNA-binding transcriptional MocR family regulator
MDTKPDLTLPPQPGPKYRRLLAALEGAIRSGALPAGARVPPVRELAWQLKVTPGTVARAYQLATEAGLLEATVGRGTFVRAAHRPLAEVPANIIARPAVGGALNMRSGHTLDIGQTALMRAELARIATDETLDLASYVRDETLANCRSAAAAWMRGMGVDADPADVVLTNGAHNAVMVALNAVLHGREPVILTSELTYPGFRQLAHIARARIVGIGSDAEGLRPDLLEAACRQHRAQALILSASVHNPDCIVTGAARRAEIARIACRHDLQIIDDDVYGTLVRDRPDGFDRLCPERAWHATSLSKCFAAGLRIGFLKCPPGAGQTGLRVMQGLSFSISQILTRLVEYLFDSGAVAEFSARIRAENIDRAGLARKTLARWQVATCQGVNFVWVGLPPGWTGTELNRACEAAGLLIAPGDSFALPGGRVPDAFRLTLSGAPERAELAAALGRIDVILTGAPQALHA